MCVYCLLQAADGFLIYLGTISRQLAPIYETSTTIKELFVFFCVHPGSSDRSIHTAPQNNHMPLFYGMNVYPVLVHIT